MRFTFIAAALMIGVTIGVTPGLRADLARMLAGLSTEREANVARQRLAGIPRRVLASLPEAEPTTILAADSETPEFRLAARLEELAPAAGEEAAPAGAVAPGPEEAGMIQVAALPAVDDPLHESEILRLSDLAPAAAPTDDFRVEQGAEPAAGAAQTQEAAVPGVALFVAIGSYPDLAAAAETVRRYAAWQPLIHKAVMNERLRHVVVLGPFSGSDIDAAIERARKAGIDDPWPLAVKLQPGLSVKGLDLFR